MGNPLVDQGTLNRLIGSVSVPSFPALNITASYLGKEGINLALEGSATTHIEVMVGNVLSGEPYRMCSVTVELLKSQALADAWKRQEELLSLIGDITVRPDTKTLSPYQIVNCGIDGVRDLKFNGTVAGYAVMIKGIYRVNSSLFDLI